MSDNNRNYILFDDLSRDRLLPFTFIRPVAEIRLGILTIREKWEMWLHCDVSALTRDYLQEKYPLVEGALNVLINGAITPNADLVEEIEALKPEEALVKDSLLIAVCLDKSELGDFDYTVPAGFIQKQASSGFLRINRPWHLFYYNGQELISDYELVTAGRISAPISSTNNLLRPDRIFAEEGAKLEYTNTQCIHRSDLSWPQYRDYGRRIDSRSFCPLRGSHCKNGS